MKHEANTSLKMQKNLEKQSEIGSLLQSFEWVLNLCKQTKGEIKNCKIRTAQCRKTIHV